MKYCKLCFRGTNNKYKICVKCADTKHFKCGCCYKLFSLNNLAQRNLTPRSRVKCDSKKKLYCVICKKEQNIISHRRSCIKCLNIRISKDYKREIIKYERLLSYEERRKEEYVEPLNNIELKILEIFTNLKKIEDPIKQYNEFNEIFIELKIETSKYDNQKKEYQLIESEIRSIQKQLKGIKSAKDKTKQALICYEATRVFMLCGTKLKIKRYIPLDIQKMIAKFILGNEFKMI